MGASNYAGGTVYYVSGGAGAFTIPKLFCGTTAGRAKCSDEHHYLLVDIQNDTMKIETWGAFPQANSVIDSITIKKGNEVCGTTRRRRSRGRRRDRRWQHRRWRR